MSSFYTLSCSFDQKKKKKSKKFPTFSFPKVFGTVPNPGVLPNVKIEKNPRVRHGFQK